MRYNLGRLNSRKSVREASRFRLAFFIPPPIKPGRAKAIRLRGSHSVHFQVTGDRMIRLELLVVATTVLGPNRANGDNRPERKPCKNDGFPACWGGSPGGD